MHEMLTVLTDVYSVTLSVTRLKSVVARALYAVCAGSFDAAFAKCLWPLVLLHYFCVHCCTFRIYLCFALRFISVLPNCYA